MDIDSFLTERHIPFQRFDHAAVFTCDEAAKLPPMPGQGTKNLFLRDDKGKRHFLVVVSHEKNVDLKELSKIIGSRKLGFASPERLKKFLGVEPGSVTILGLVHDTDRAVELFMDEDIANADSYQCHPLVNTATLVISRSGIEAFLSSTGHGMKVIHVPSRLV
ncbi:MAG: prolyl-tRNA synthetase associated domain-containing protein [Candidatus Peribacteraceae bacterium]|jgi:Ala-tRNA(Pro) deacylase